MSTNNEIRAYKDEYYPPVPTRMTRFWRTCIMYQIFRFFVLNYKIMKMVVKGHS
ncbi:MAG TPA: hypothetical protein P5531_07650 [Bacteroidales bacterium]|nr:hypothetical protein [Bacteroidales bacterium]HSA43240.1 hypothetical protein [Bacteroidales bacterium]